MKEGAFFLFYNAMVLNKNSGSDLYFSQSCNYTHTHTHI